MCIAKKKKLGPVLKKVDPLLYPAAPVRAPKSSEASDKSKSRRVGLVVVDVPDYPKDQYPGDNVESYDPSKVRRYDESDSSKVRRSDKSYGRKANWDDDCRCIEEIEEQQTDKPHDIEEKNNENGEKLWNEKKAMKQKKIDEYEAVKNVPLKEKEEDVDTRVESLIVDETQKSVIEDWVDTKYRDTARPMWVMDEQHDRIALTWLRVMNREVKIWKAMYEVIQKWKFDGVTFYASDRNYELNRDGGVGCQDKGRIILTVPGLKSDYIHANYIGIPTNPKRFICTQTPMKSTIHAFWAMVIQEKVEQIVVKDKNQKSFEKYWPMMEDEKMEFEEGVDKIIVTHKTIHSIMESIKEYELKVYWGDGQQRTVSVYQYNGDYKCQYLINLEFLPVIWNNKNPVVVHDSSGVGYSGSLIVAALIHEKMVDGDDCLNMVDIVKDLRKQRFGLLNTFRSYWSMYRTIREFLEDRCQYNPGFHPRFEERKVKKRVTKV